MVKFNVTFYFKTLERPLEYEIDGSAINPLRFDFVESKEKNRDIPVIVGNIQGSFAVVNLGDVSHITFEMLPND